MPQLFPGQWVSNDWPSIDIEPVEFRLVLPLLTHLAVTYQFPLPAVQHLPDLTAADFQVLGAEATLMLDPWFLSLAFDSAAVRDRVLADLLALPSDFFPV